MQTASIQGLSLVILLSFLCAIRTHLGVWKYSIAGSVVDLAARDEWALHLADHSRHSMDWIP
jgi:hypothetical protein